MARVAELVWKSDNRSVIRDLRQIADQSDKTKTQIKGDAEEQATSFDKVRRSTSLLRDSVYGLAGMVGFGGLAFGLKDAVQGGMALQAAQAQLRTSLGNSKAAFEQLNATAVKSSTHGGFGTTQNLTSLTALVRETHSASEATKLFGLETDIARGRNLSLASAQTVVQRAYTGSVGRLQQLLGPMVAAKAASYGLTQAHREEIVQLELQSKSMGKLGPQWLAQQEALDNITPRMQALATLQDKSATAQQVLGAAQTAFGGSTAAFSSTTSGQMSNLQNSLKNLADESGERLLPVVTKLAQWGTVAVSALSRVPAPILAATVGLVGLGSTVGFLKGSLGNLASIFKIFGGEVSTAGAAALRGGEESSVGGAVGGVGEAEVGAGAVASAGRLGGALSTAGKLILPAFLGYQAFKALSPTDQYNPAPAYEGGHALYRAHGGVVPRYMASGGPMGTDTVPAYLSPGEGVLSLAGMQALGALNSGGTGGGQEITIRVPVQLDGRTLTESVVRYSLNRGARGPTSLVGGSLVTGAPGLPS